MLQLGYNHKFKTFFLVGVGSFMVLGGACLQAANNSPTGLILKGPGSGGGGASGEHGAICKYRTNVCHRSQILLVQYNTAVLL